jgi:alpha-L-rhamnosidase
MEWARGHLDAMYGRIESAWKCEGDTVTYRFTVPANTTATLFLRTTSPDVVTESGAPASESEGVRFIGYEDGKARYELVSGDYTFEVALESC